MNPESSAARGDENVAPAYPAPDVRDKGGYGRLIANSDFRKLWVGQFVSAMGDWLIVGILIPTVTALSGNSSTAVAGILIAKIIPALILSSFTGVLVDHFSRRTIMLAADLVRLGLVLVLLFTNNLFIMYLIILLMETASLFFWPARNALIPQVVEERDISIANGFMYTTQQCAMIVGLATSGAILAGFTAVVTFLFGLPMPEQLRQFTELISPILLGSRAGYFVDSFTFILSALMIWRLRTDAKPPNAGQRLSFSTIGKDAIESFRFLGGHTELRGLLLSIFFAIIGGGAVVTVGLNYIATLAGKIPFADKLTWVAQFSSSRQIFVLTFLAVGMLAGAVLVPRVEKRVSVRLLFPSSIAVFAAGMVGFAFTRQYFPACLFATGAGLCIAMLTVTGNNYIVQHVADEIRGRVFTALESVIRIALLISTIVTAPVSDLISGVVRRILMTLDITTFLHVELTGSRITLLFSACIVAVAAVYGFKKLYFEPGRTAEVERAEAGEVVQ